MLQILRDLHYCSFGRHWGGKSPIRISHADLVLGFERGPISYTVAMYVMAKNANLESPNDLKFDTKKKIQLNVHYRKSFENHESLPRWINLKGALQIREICIFLFLGGNGQNFTEFGAHVLGTRTNKNLCHVVPSSHRNSSAVRRAYTPIFGRFRWRRGYKWESWACKCKRLQVFLRWSIKNFLGVKSSLNCYFGLAKPEIHRLLSRGFHPGQLNCFFAASEGGGVRGRSQRYLLGSEFTSCSEKAGKVKKHCKKD